MYRARLYIEYYHIIIIKTMVIISIFNMFKLQPNFCKNGLKQVFLLYCYFFVDLFINFCHNKFRKLSVEN